MELKDFELEKKRLKYEHEKKCQALAIRFAMDKNVVEVGDIVTDHIGSVKVEKISVSGVSKPQCVYSGPEYTKCGVPFKSGSSRQVYESNIEARQQYQ